MHPNAELVALENRCPECSEDNLLFVTYDADHNCIFQCFNCRWSDSIPLPDLVANGFYPEMFDDVEPSQGGK
ncbi:hypothetical protein [Nostoc sp.]|uniref:hypothetical protein n=1 Tax=Nostoc sp. TaxID=1180 RepID=UPI002FFC83FB